MLDGRCLNPLPRVKFQAMVGFLKKCEYSLRLRLVWHVAHIEAKRAGKIRSSIFSLCISSFVRGGEIIG